MGGSVVHQLARLPQELRSGSSGFNTRGSLLQENFTSSSHNSIVVVVDDGFFSFSLIVNCDYTWC